MSDLKKSGLVLYYIDGDDVYFRCMIPSNPAYGGSNPQIPKGTIDQGDSSKFTAIKECIEEVGLKSTNLKTIEKFKVYPEMKMVVYVGTVKDINDFGKPHWESKWSGWISYKKEGSHLRKLQQHIFDDIYQHLMS